MPVDLLHLQVYPVGTLPVRIADVAGEHTLNLHRLSRVVPYLVNLYHVWFPYHSVEVHRRDKEKRCEEHHPKFRHGPSRAASVLQG